MHKTYKKLFQSDTRLYLFLTDLRVKFDDCIYASLRQVKHIDRDTTDTFTWTRYGVHTISFQTFFVQAFKIVVDS